MRRAKIYDLSRHNHLSTIMALQEALRKCDRGVDGVMVVIVSDNGRRVVDTIVAGSLANQYKALFQATRIQKDIINQN